MTVEISFIAFEHGISTISKHEEQYFHVRRIHTYLSPTNEECLCACLKLEDGTELTIPNCISVVSY